MVSAVIDILVNNVNFQNEAGQNKSGSKYKAFPVVSGQNEQPPYSIVRQANYLPQDCKTGIPTTYQGAFDVASYHKNFEDCVELDKAVLAALHRKAGTHKGVQVKLITYQGTSDGPYDVDRACYVRISSFTCWVDESAVT